MSKLNYEQEKELREYVKSAHDKLIKQRVFTAIEMAQLSQVGPNVTAGLATIDINPQEICRALAADTAAHFCTLGFTPIEMCEWMCENAGRMFPTEIDDLVKECCLDYFREARHEVPVE